MSSLLVLNRVFFLSRDIVNHVGISTGFVNYFPLTFSLVSSPPLPSSTVNTVSILYTRIHCTVHCVRGGGEEYGVIGGEGGPQTDRTPAARSFYRSIFLYNNIWHSFLSLKSFYALQHQPVSIRHRK